MKILIISDIHANAEALAALPGGYDRLFCLGDLVDYGPDPAACIDWVREHASACVRGNHDHAVGFHADCRCSAAYRRLSQTTRAATWPLLRPGQEAYLRQLPEQILTEAAGARFFLTHATVHDPMYGYLDAAAERCWAEEMDGIAADVVLTGHTHVPVCRRIGPRWLLNPGSVGQSKVDGGRAHYAWWEDGELRLESVPYAVGRTTAKLAAWTAVPEDVRASLAFVLETGSGPQRPGSPAAPATEGSPCQER
jgi:putative phosphoesterase